MSRHHNFIFFLLVLCGTAEWILCWPAEKGIRLKWTCSTEKMSQGAYFNSCAEIKQPRW